MAAALAAVVVKEAEGAAVVVVVAVRVVGAVPVVAHQPPAPQQPALLTSPSMLVASIISLFPLLWRPHPTRTTRRRRGPSQNRTPHARVWQVGLHLLMLAPLLTTDMFGNHQTVPWMTGLFRPWTTLSVHCQSSLRAWKARHLVHPPVLPTRFGCGLCLCVG